jgi:hypothetical protein
MQWYYSKNGRQLGPVEESELRAKLASGEVAQTDLVWRDGMGDWRPAGGVPELARPVAHVLPVSFEKPGEASPYAAPATRDIAPASYGPLIPNYLWQSIVVTIFCCWPFGIPAIVYSSKVDGLRASGDIQGAMAASASAKNWCLAAVLSWVVLVVLAIILSALGVWVTPAHPNAF